MINDEYELYEKLFYELDEQLLEQHIIKCSYVLLPRSWGA